MCSAGNIQHVYKCLNEVQADLKSSIKKYIKEKAKMIQFLDMLMANFNQNAFEASSQKRD